MCDARNQNNNDAISRIESKLENIEKSNALNIVGLHQKINVQETDINLIKGDFKKQFTILKNYIKELENKIEKLNNDKVVVVAKKVEKTDISDQKKYLLDQKIEVLKFPYQMDHHLSGWRVINLLWKLVINYN